MDSNQCLKVLGVDPVVSPRYLSSLVLWVRRKQYPLKRFSCVGGTPSVGVCRHFFLREGEPATAPTHILFVAAGGETMFSARDFSRIFWRMLWRLCMTLEFACLSG